MANKRFPTKIIPPQHERVFPRKHLLSLFAKQPLTPLIWLNGPPGAGKTVFTVNLHTTRQSRFLWYRMDGCENNSADLFYFLALAAERNYPRKRLNLPVFTSEYANDIDAFSRVFFRQLFARLPNETAIVLDNCQEAEQDRVFIKVLLIAVSELPQNMQIFCLSRNKPSSALARLQLNNEMMEINAGDLQFDAAESRAFLQWLNPQFDSDSLQKLASITQGWATGMVLLAGSLQQHNIDINSPRLKTNEAVFNYLLGEIFSHLPPEALEFMVKTALFEQFTADMGKQISVYPETRQFLDNLVNKNLLIEKTGDAKPVYTYHPLLRETLLERADTLFDARYWHATQLKAAETLVLQQRPVEAMQLYRQLQDWPALEALLLQQANGLIKTGRYQAVGQWIDAFPDDYLTCKPWLTYWQAEALKPVDPMLAASLLNQCYQQFIDDNDITGVYSAWQGAVEAICIGMDDYSGLEVWLQRFDALRKNYPRCPSFELKIRFYATAVQALSFYNPQHAWLKGLVRISELALRIIPIKQLRAMISTQLAHNYTIAININKYQVVAPYLEKNLEDETLPALARIMNAYILAIMHQYQGQSESALAFSLRGLELSEQTGISVFKGFFYLNIVGNYIWHGDIKGAQQALNTAFEHINPRHRMHIALYHFYRAWISALNGERELALEQIDVSLQLARQIQVDSGYIYSLAFKVELLAELSQWDKAEQNFQLLASKVADSKTKYHQIIYHYVDAWLGYLSDNHSRTVSAFERFLGVVKAEQVLFILGWRPDALAPLCILAIENNIETDYAVRLMSMNSLLPKPPVYLEQWPWRVRIYCFQHLHIQLNNKALAGQKRINALLSAIVAQGGKEVPSDQLAQMLWPDADGDMAQQSLETALHRLRKQIGKQAILVKAGKISINSRYCWLDLWAFEATARELKSVFLKNPKYQNVVNLTDRLLNLYQGPFLNHSDQGSVILKREQLQNTLLRLLSLAADFHEQRQENERAGLLLKKKLELEPLLETNYQRLMVHFMKLQQSDQALHVYQQCQRILSEGFGLTLSDDIQSYAKQITSKGTEPR